MSEPSEYRCDKCKTKTYLHAPHEYCVCGGKLIPTSKEILDTIFGDILKEQE